MLKSTRLLSLAFAVALASLITLAAPSPGAFAHGGTVKLDVDAGPYHVVVVTNPTSNPGEMLLTVILNEVQKGDQPPDAVTGAAVKASFSPTGTTTVRFAHDIPPEPRLADSGYYEKRVAVPSEGDWQVRLEIAGPPGSTTVNFPVSVRRSPAWAEWLGWGSVAAVVLVALGGLIYLARVRPRTTPPDAAAGAAPPR